MNKVLAVIACVAVLGVSFCPGPCANPYGVPRNKLKHGIPIEVILKHHHNLVIHNHKLVTSGKALDVRVLNDTQLIKNHHAYVFKQFYDKKSERYVILGLKNNSLSRRSETNGI